MATSPDPSLDFYVPARSFAEATKLIRSSPHYSGREPMMFLPIHLLFGFAVELYLKAWLSKAGIEPDALARRPYGHHLVNLYRGAIDAGLPNLAGLGEVISVLHGPHSRFEYRYFKSPSSFESLGALQITSSLERLDTEVDRFIGASASRGLEPGH